MLRRFASFTLLLGLAGCPAAALPEVARYRRFEVSYPIAGLTRHPDEVTIRAELTAPSGKVTGVGGFPSRGVFKTRFLPIEVGEHRYVVRANGGAGEQEVAKGAFLSTAGEGRGFVRVDPARPHQLAFEDGSPFVILGENRINIYDPSWNYGAVGIQEYLAQMAAHGMTTVRVFIFTDGEAEDRPGGAQLGCLEPVLGRFDEAVAEDFDALFEAAEAHGIYVVLTAFSLGFTPGETWKSWEDNPYNVARGGLAKDPWEFFDVPLVREHAKRRLRYLLDRWGYSPNLLAVDLLNEPEWDGGIGEDAWIPWAGELADYWRAQDPFGRLITVGSVGLHWNIEGDEKRWYSDSRGPLLQWHLYGEDFYPVHALAAELSRKVAETWGHGKPIFVGEFAWGGEDKTTYDHTHVGLWSTVFSGAGVLAHSAPPFTLDSDEPMTPERGRHFRVLADFLRPLRDGAQLEPASALATTSLPGARVWTLGSGPSRALWLMGPKAGYGSLVSAMKVSVPGLTPGEYRLEWFDDLTGAVVESRGVSAAAAPLALQAPAFKRHIAATLTPLAP